MNLIRFFISQSLLSMVRELRCLRYVRFYRTLMCVTTLRLLMKYWTFLQFALTKWANCRLKIIYPNFKKFQN